MRECVRAIIFPGYTFTTDDRVAFQRRSTLSTGQIYANPVLARVRAAGHSRLTERSNASANAPTYCLPVAVDCWSSPAQASHRVLARRQVERTRQPTHFRDFSPLLPCRSGAATKEISTKSLNFSQFLQPYCHARNVPSILFFFS